MHLKEMSLCPYRPHFILCTLRKAHRAKCTAKRFPTILHPLPAHDQHAILLHCLFFHRPTFRPKSVHAIGLKTWIHQVVVVLNHLPSLGLLHLELRNPAMQHLLSVTSFLSKSQTVFETYSTPKPPCRSRTGGPLTSILILEARGLPLPWLVTLKLPCATLHNHALPLLVQSPLNLRVLPHHTCTRQALVHKYLLQLVAAHNIANDLLDFNMHILLNHRLLRINANAVTKARPPDLAVHLSHGLPLWLSTKHVQHPPVEYHALDLKPEGSSHATLTEANHRFG